MDYYFKDHKNDTNNNISGRAPSSGGAPRGTGFDPNFSLYGPRQTPQEPPAPEKPAQPKGEAGGPRGEGPRRRAGKAERRLQAVKLTVLAVAVTALTFVSFLIPLRPSVSMAESRELAKFPSFSFGALFSGKYFSGISAWFADTVPMRDTLTSLSSKLQHLLGTGTAQAGFSEGVQGDDIPDVPDTPATAPVDNPESTVAPQPSTDPQPSAGPQPSVTDVSQTTEQPSTEPPTTGAEEPTQEVQQLSNILVYGNAGYEYYYFVKDTADSYVAAVNRASQVLAGRATVYDIIIPTSMDIVLPTSVRQSLSVSDQKKAIGYMEGLLDPAVRRVSVFDELYAHRNEYVYFRADHHWTGLGAYYAYVKFCQAKGVPAVQLADCTYYAFDNFLGSFYADSGNSPAMAATPDTVEVYMPKVNADIVITESSGNQIKGSVIYDASTNIPRYKYSAFIWGDNPFSVIENHDMAAGESCLLIKESFGNAFAPYLTYNYKYVYVMDYRYCKESVNSLVQKYGITDVIFCNNISMTRAKPQVTSLNNCIG